jgi:plasmid stabilization system protein ParE
MRRPYVITLEAPAARQVDEARAWLLANVGAWRAELLDQELGAALRLLETCPEMYALAPGSKNVRRLRLKRSGYHVYYRVVHRRRHVHVVWFWQQSRPLPRPDEV